VEAGVEVSMPSHSVKASTTWNPPWIAGHQHTNTGDLFAFRGVQNEWLINGHFVTPASISSVQTATQ